MLGHRRFRAALLIVTLLLFLAFSSGYILLESGHDCSGEDCPVCAVLALCVQSLDRGGDVALTVFAAALWVFVSAPALPRRAAVRSATQVSLKVEMHC